MRTLADKFSNSGNQSNATLKSREEIVDTIFCLMGALAEGTLMCAGPDRISVELDGTVNTVSPEEIDLYYAAPEIVLGETKDDENSKWFTLGLLAYYVLTGKNLYEDKKIDLVSMKELQGKGEGLTKLTMEDLACNNEAISDLVNAVNLFLSWSAVEREKGAAHVLAAVKKCLTVADVKYYLKDTPVLSEMLKITQPRHLIGKGTSVAGKDGKNYVVVESVTIPMRAGKHSYRVMVKKA